ncbi:MAG: GspE/PulE family protein, partial [Planctomycetota bacterium]|nr:GspE/PulE family protein [Planctomycetota bacterium]
KLKFATPGEVSRALAKQLRLKFFPGTSETELPPALIDLVPRSVAQEHKVIPVQRTEKTIVLACPEPLDLFALDNLRFILNTEVETALADPVVIRMLLKKYYSGDGDGGIGGDLEGEVSVKEDSIGDMTGEEDAPVIRLVHKIILDAINDRASDIHIEPMEDRVRVRVRIDGQCVERESPAKQLQGPIISRIKIMSRMDMAEKRRPQDGRIKMVVDGREIDFRVSSLPATHGESVVIRILDKEKSLVGLDQLGFFAGDEARFNKVIKRPNGIFLVTGPTGSGKTTTLYAAMMNLNRPDVKIITAENPIEYNITGINQCEVRQRIDLTFSRILRAMLRQAPNIILVGEIRDSETADIAIQAALTGHLVFSTLHTNDAPTAITRLIDMGVKPFLVASAILAVMAQRLLRILCDRCKSPYEPTETELRQVGLRPEDIEGKVLYRAEGCEVCGYVGFRGRKGAFELMDMTPELRELAFRKRPTNELRKEALRGGMTTLQEDAVRKVFAGITTIDEVLWITQSADLSLL